MAEQQTNIPHPANNELAQDEVSLLLALFRDSGYPLNGPEKQAAIALECDTALRANKMDQAAVNRRIAESKLVYYRIQDFLGPLKIGPIRAEIILEKFCRLGWYCYEVSHRVGWLTLLGRQEAHRRYVATDTNTNKKKAAVKEDVLTLEVVKS